MTKELIELALAALESEEKNLSSDQLQRLAKMAKVGERVRYDLVEKLESKDKRKLTPEQQNELFLTLETRFVENSVHYKHQKGVKFIEVKKALEAHPDFMYSLSQMEKTGGFPDVIINEDDVFVFADCSRESPARRNINYDQSLEMAKEFGVDMLTEEAYRIMQKIGIFDSNTWSWLSTPNEVRESGKAINGGRFGSGVSVSKGEWSKNTLSVGWRGMVRVPKIRS